MSNKITIPKKSKYLAEETGIHMGDGYMKIRKDVWGVHYEYAYSGHAHDDEDYIKYVKLLMKKLYNLNPGYERLTNENGFNMSYFSKNLTNFKLSIGLPLSPKNNLEIPKWIKNNEEFSKNFLRGLFDTDGCLTFKGKNENLHNYPYITLGLKNRKFIYELGDLLKKFSFDLNICKHYKIASNGTRTITWDIGLSGKDNLLKYMKDIGFNNSKHITKYLIWMKFGFCPPHTTLKQRKEILSDKLDPLLLEKVPRGRFERPITAL